MRRHEHPIESVTSGVIKQGFINLMEGGLGSVENLETFVRFK